MTPENGKKISGKWYLLFGVGAFLFFLLLNLPAARVYSLLQDRGLDQQVKLHGLNGTWLSGGAASGLVQQVPISDLSWKLRPSLPTRLRAKVAFSLGDGGHFDGVIVAGAGGRIGLTDARASLPLPLLQEILGKYGVELAGQAEMRLDRLELRDNFPSAARGTLELAAIQLLRPMNIFLGDFKGEVVTTGEGMKIILVDDGGPLAVDTVLLLQPDGAYSLSGILTARDQELAPALRLLGPPGRDGSVPLSLSGRLAL